MKSLLRLVSIASLILLVGCNFDEPKKYNQYVVYDFWASWCGPCIKLAPTFEQWEKKYARGNVVFKRVNVDEDPETAKKFKIEGLPTVIVTGDGKEIGRFIGLERIREERIAGLLR